jgi:hypothetical protein
MIGLIIQQNSLGRLDSGNRLKGIDFGAWIKILCRYSGQMWGNLSRRHFINDTFRIMQYLLCYRTAILLL